jgi:pimeloyl-ACP methyl ester carboxylesterase
MNWSEFQRKQRVVEIGDSFLSYVDEGSGSPVVLLHGMPSWGYVWSSVLPLLTNRFRVLIPDLAGFGYSDKRDCFDRSVSRQSTLIESWMDSIGLSHPESHRRLSSRRTNLLLRRGLKKGFSQPQEEYLSGMLAPYTTEIGKLSLIRNAVALNTSLTMEISALLHHLRVPTLIISGEDDPFHPIKYGTRLATDIPGAQLVRLQKARHFVMLDRPEIIATCLTQFLGPEGRVMPLPQAVHVPASETTVRPQFLLTEQS